MCVYYDGRGTGLLSPRPLPFPLRNSPNQKMKAKHIKILSGGCLTRERGHIARVEDATTPHMQANTPEHVPGRSALLLEANLYSSSNDSSRALYRNAPRVASADMCHVPLCIEKCLS